MNSWQAIKLGDVANIYDGTHQTPDYVSDGVPFYSVEHVTSNDFSNTKYVSWDVYEKEIKRVKIEPGDILMTRIGDVGTAKYIYWDKPSSFYVSLALIKCKDMISSEYLTQLINSDVFHREIWGKTIHVAFPNKINLGDISKCRLLLPEKPEQQRIVSVLETWDEYLELLDKKIALKEQLKKGLIQKTIYNNSENYVTKSITDIGILLKNGVPKFENNKKYYSTAAIIDDNKVEDISYEFRQSRADMYPELNDIGIAKMKGTNRCFVVNNELFGNIFSTGFAFLRVKKDYDYRLIYQLLNTKKFQYYKDLYSSSGIMGGINNGDFLGLEIKIPEAKNEQAFIANILSDSDDEINYLKAYKKVIMLQKKYLLNNLITGKILTPENLSMKGVT